MTKLIAYAISVPLLLIAVFLTAVVAGQAIEEYPKWKNDQKPKKEVDFLRGA